VNFNLRVTVKIPPALIQYTGKDSMVDVDASTVEEALMQLDSRFPGLRALLVDESRELRRYVNVFVNQLDIRSAGGLKTNLKEGDRVTIIPAVAGG
jgi:molybdopterin synthase sulfur carrier subunit